MKAIHKVIAALGVVASASITSVAFAQASDANLRVTQFRDTEATMQQDSTNMPYASALDAKSAPSADPVPGATTRQQKSARFGAEEKALQQESTSMPAPAREPDTAAADAVPRATNQAERRARFEQMEREMQQESTP
ncbi:MAG TPA: hypothetical protein VMV45_07505 [Casimicrobiaceae bacterium]|nr:hypothetical protein [Casimicrobiaceae bacterium]